MRSLVTVIRCGAVQFDCFDQQLRYTNYAFEGVIESTNTTLVLEACKTIGSVERYPGLIGWYTKLRSLKYISIFSILSGILKRNFKPSATYLFPTLLKKVKFADCRNAINLTLHALILVGISCRSYAY